MLNAKSQDLSSQRIVVASLGGLGNFPYWADLQGKSRAPEAPVNVRPENSGFEASKMTKSLSVDSRFQTIKGGTLVQE
jgi:hypothetical protein